MQIPKRTNLNNTDDQFLTYIKLLLKKKGMDIMPPDILAEMMLDLYSRFEAHLLVGALRKIDPGKYEEFDRLVEGEDGAAKGLEFIKANLRDYQTVILEIMADFEKTYLAA
ncbi:MAG: DUF5663 domain-containing protein [Planctomycetes bacterium]|jgi:hypothetical protein|nr:DUF5663 domain-containing protein [Planctomycetota bacterium]